MRPKQLIIALLGAWLGLTFVGLFASEAEAIPAFARKYGTPCSTCHSAWPMLNSMGREFKENGYKFQRDEEPENIISDFLQLDGYIPVAAIVVSRPYDKKESGSDKLRAIHEVELMAAGVVYKDVSVFFELEAEDETGFEVEVPTAFLTYHPFEYLNLQLAWGGAFVSDPYDILADRRLTRGRNKVIDNRFGGADNNGRIRDARQSVSIYGRLLDRMLFYSVGYSAVPGNAEGEDPGTFNGRLAVDVMPELTIGAFGMVGECQTTATNCSRDRNFQRIGFDVRADIAVPMGNLRLQGAYVHAKDDRDTTGKDDNDAWFVEGIYIIQGDDDRPWIVPSVRFDYSEQNDGADDFGELTLNLSYYLYENVKVYAEYFKQVEVPNGVEKDGRFTIQAVIGF